MCSQAILVVLGCEDESQSAFPQALLSPGILDNKTEFKLVIGGEIRREGLGWK